MWFSALVVYVIYAASLRAEPPRSPANVAVATSTLATSQPLTPELMKQASYAIGYQQGQIILRESLNRTHIDVDLAAAGLKDAFAGSKPPYPAAEMSRALQIVFGPRVSGRAGAEQNAQASREFLAKNRTVAGVTTLPSGLQYRPILTGTGPRPRSTDRVLVRHRGTLIDGTEFAPAGNPVSLDVRATMPGWREILPLMPAGSKYEVFVPPHLAYGAAGFPPKIPPQAVLVCEIELLKVQGAPGAPEMPPASPAPQR